MDPAVRGAEEELLAAGADGTGDATRDPHAAVHGDGVDVALKRCRRTAAVDRARSEAHAFRHAHGGVHADVVVVDVHAALIARLALIRSDVAARARARGSGAPGARPRGGHPRKRHAAG